MSIAKTAYEFMLAAHDGQLDKQGFPYHLHTERVGASVAHFGAEFEAAGYLHDTVEDTNTTLEGLRALGMPETVVVAVEHLTKRSEEKGHNGYMRFIERAAKDPIAREVKKADIKDNMRPGGSQSLYKRYSKALAYLEAL